MLTRYFDVDNRGTTTRTELRGGLATFFTMAYIVVLNPIILSGATDGFGRHLSLAQVATSTALVAAVMTILMGIWGRYPFALAAGLGINGVVAFSIAPQMSWPAAMGIVVLEGLAITVLVLTGFREAVFEAIPMALKQAISVGIGMFIAFIGFVDGGIVRRNGADPVPVSLGPAGRLIGWPSVVFCFGLLFTGVLVARRTKAAILIGIVTTTVFAMIVNAIFDVPPQILGGRLVHPGGWGLNVPKFPHKFVSSPDFGLIGHFSLGGGVKAIGWVSAVLLVYTLMLADFFDTMGTVVGVGAEGGLLDEQGRLPGLARVLLVDSLAAVAGGATSSSSSTTYIESAAGVADGARTGLASVVTGVLFIAALFFTPLVEVVPYEAASPALVIVGFLLMTQVRNIPWDDYDLSLPAFLTIVVMPFTYSITNGIGAGFIAYSAIKLFRGKAREVHWMMWIVTASFLIYFAIDPVERLLGVH